jgi:hypothetical protein
MIISDKYRFAFVHIPKCAGIYVRNCLAKYDDTHGAFTSRVEKHPQLGLLDYVHIPLAVLEEYFADEYTKVCDYASYAVIRNPYERFPSAMAQRLRQYGAKGIQQLSRQEIVAETERVMHWIAAHRDMAVFPPEYIYFQPQVSYIFNGDARIVKHVYLLEQVDAMLADLEQLSGEQIRPAQAADNNVTRVYRSEPLRRAFETIRPLYDRFGLKLLPQAAIDFLKGLVFTPGGKKSKSHLDEIFASREIIDFINDVYRADIDFYRQSGGGLPG